MPRKYRNQRRSKRPSRRARKSYRRRVRRSGTLIQRGMGPIAPRLITSFKYVQNVTDMPTIPAGGLIDYVFSLNSLYLPNPTTASGSGLRHQPYGFDQFSVMYGRYRVFAVSYRIQFHDVAGAAPLTVVVLPSNQMTPYPTGGTLTTYMEMQRARYYTLVPGIPTKYVKGHVSLPKLNGSTTTAYKSDDRFQAAISASPVEAMGLHIIASAPAATAGVRFVIQLRYHCELFDPPTYDASVF